MKGLCQRAVMVVLTTFILTRAAGADEVHIVVRWSQEQGISEVQSADAISLRVREQASRAGCIHTLARPWALGPTPGHPGEFPDLALFDDVAHPGPSCYVPEERCIYLGLHAPPDDLPHEMGHAFVDLLKPGFRLGAVRVIHEAIADTVAVLCAYRDPECLERVLCETKGNLRQESEATRIQGRDCLRSACCPLSLEQIGFDRRRVTLSEVEVPNTLCDPHYVSQVLTAALHDVFCGLYEGELARGTSPREAIERSSDTAGRLMFRALLFVGEHRVSLRDYATALLRADRYLCDTRCRTILEPILLERGFFVSAEELQEAHHDTPVVSFRLDVREENPRRLLERAWDLEGLLLDQVRAVPAGRTLDRYDIPLLFHRHAYPCPLFVDPASVSIDSDQRTPEGFRVLRVSYLCPLDPATKQAYERMFGGTQRSIREAETPQKAYASCLFDPTGHLVEIHADRPMPEILHGYL